MSYADNILPAVRGDIITRFLAGESGRPNMGQLRIDLFPGTTAFDTEVNGMSPLSSAITGGPQDISFGGFTTVGNTVSFSNSNTILYENTSGVDWPAFQTLGIFSTASLTAFYGNQVLIQYVFPSPITLVPGQVARFGPGALEIIWT